MSVCPLYVVCSRGEERERALRSVCRFEYHPIQLFRDDTNYTIDVWHEHDRCSVFVNGITI